MRFSLRSLFVITALLSVALLCAPTVYRNAQWYAGVPLKGRGVSAWEANRWLPPDYRVPKGATDVHYQVDAKYAVVGFAVSEKTFIEWSTSRGWETRRFEPDGLTRGMTHPPEYEFRFVRGYDWTPPGGGIGFFDAELSRVIVEVQWAP